MKMDNYCMEQQEDKKKQHKKSIVIYSAIVLFTIIINVPIFTFITNEFVGNLTFYLNQYLKLYPIKPVIFPPILKIFSMCLIVNLFLLLVIEFVVVCLFRKRLNKFFKIDNLFTLKKFAWLVVIIISVQLIISCWMWQIDPQHGDFYPIEEELIEDE